MSDYKILLSTQYAENYAAHNNDWNGTDEAWKNKGGVEFTIDISSAQRMFLTNDEVASAIDEILAAKSNKVVRYEAVGFDYLDGTPEDLTTAFTKIIDERQAQFAESLSRCE